MFLCSSFVHTKEASPQRERHDMTQQQPQNIQRSALGWRFNTAAKVNPIVDNATSNLIF